MYVYRSNSVVNGTELIFNSCFQMFCEADAAFIESVCTTWQSPQFCNHSSVYAYGNRSVVYASGNRLFTVMEKGGKEVMEPYVNKSRMTKFLPQLLYFDAQLLPGHTSQGTRKVLGIHRL